MKVPEIVLKEAQETLDLLGGKIAYLGKKDGYTYYVLDTDAVYGEYPFIYRYDGHKVQEMSGELALEIEDELMVK